MATMAEIRAGLAANLAGLAGVQVSAYMLSSPTTPGIDVFPETVEYDMANARGLDHVTMIVRGATGLLSDIAAQQKLDVWLAPAGGQSVKAAVESDRTLGGLVHDLRVVSMSGYRVYGTEGRSPVLGCEWSVLVLNRT